LRSAVRRDFSGNYTSPKVSISIHGRGKSQPVIVHSDPDSWPIAAELSKKKATSSLMHSSDENAMSSRSVSHLANSGKIPSEGVVHIPGGVPLYKSSKGKNVLVGSIAVSGDSPDVDEAIAVAAAEGFHPSKHIRSDTVMNIPYTSDLEIEELDDKRMPLKLDGLVSSCSLSSLPILVVEEIKVSPKLSVSMELPKLESLPPSPSMKSLPFLPPSPSMKSLPFLPPSPSMKSLPFLPKLSPSMTSLPKLSPSMTSLPKLSPSITSLPKLSPSMTSLPLLPPSPSMKSLQLPPSPSMTSLPKLSPSMKSLPKLPPSPSMTSLPVLPSQFATPKMEALPKAQGSPIKIPLLSSSSLIPRSKATLSPQAIKSPNLPSLSKLTPLK